jgi:hypothetical protein
VRSYSCKVELATPPWGAGPCLRGGHGPGGGGGFDGGRGLVLEPRARLQLLGHLGVRPQGPCLGRLWRRVKCSELCGGIWGCDHRGPVWGGSGGAFGAASTAGAFGALTSGWGGGGSAVFVSGTHRRCRQRSSALGQQVGGASYNIELAP